MSMSLAAYRMEYLFHSKGKKVSSLRQFANGTLVFTWICVDLKKANIQLKYKTKIYQKIWNPISILKRLIRSEERRVGKEMMRRGEKGEGGRERERRR